VLPSKRGLFQAQVQSCWMQCKCWTVYISKGMPGVESGIIDPAKVTRSALQNAAMILTTEALIKDLPEKEKPAFPAMKEY
jgi:hypothetical protein